MSHEITVSWDKNPAPGATYNVYRGTAHGNEAPIPYATGIANPPDSAVSAVAAPVAGLATYTGTFPAAAANAFEGMKVTIAGFANAANNGQFVVSSSDAVSLVLENPAAIAEAVAATATPRPYFIDTGVLLGKVYSYEITAVVSGVESVDSVEIISPPVPFPPTPATVDLGLATSFEILGGSAITNTGPSKVGGDIGVFPGSAITGFGPPAVIAGVPHVADFVAAAAQGALTAAYLDAAGRTGATVLPADIGGMTLLPGVYSVATSLGITGWVVLDAQGDPDATWIFQIGSTLTTAAGNSVVLLANGAQAHNVFWQVGSSATINGGGAQGTYFAGTIMALASITATAGANIDGRLLARNGAVTIDTDTIYATITAPLAVYAVNTFEKVGAIIFDCVTQTYQQVIVEGTTGATRPAFNPTVGGTTADGGVIWVNIDPEITTIIAPLPPSPPNTPPAPPAAPTNPELSSET